MKTITVEYLKSVNACDPGVDAFQKQYPDGVKLDVLIRFCLDSKNLTFLSHGNWLICRCFTEKQKVQYAIYAARLVLDIYEKQYPDNKAPKKAIESAEAYLVNPCAKTKKAAYAAAAAAAAAYAAADAADDAYAAAYAADAARLEMRTKILAYGLSLLRK